MISKKIAIRFILFVFSAYFLLACETLPPDRKAIGPEDSLKAVPVSAMPQLKDDMDAASLACAIEQNIIYMMKTAPDSFFIYGEDSYFASDILEAQKKLLDFLRLNPSVEQLAEMISGQFKFYKAAGNMNAGGRVLFTGYFEPEYEGRRGRDDVFRHPLHGTPDDIIYTDLTNFGYDNKQIVMRVEGNRGLPYFTREEIAEKGAIDGRGIEIAWLKDPVDVAFLQIQGSGRLQLEDGSMVRVGYAGRNGRPYRSIGNILIEEGHVTGDDMSMQAIRVFLENNPDEVSRVLNYNQSYIFFRKLETPPVGSLGVLITPGRTIALDSRLFPKGALGFIVCQKPVADETGRITGWEPFTRFVLNQDTGGAIKGAGRADIFWGHGNYAELAAGHLKHEGELYILGIKNETEQ